MCGFCAVFSGIPHWTEVASDAGDHEPSGGGPVWRLARQRRLHILNAVLAQFGCQLEDWMGGQYMLRSQRGQTEMIDHLPAVWRLTETIAARPCDPLDPCLLAALRAYSTARAP